MAGLRFTDIQSKPNEVRSLTSLTVEEFQSLVPHFEEAFQIRMATWCLDGKKRTGKRFKTYKNCPLPTPEDRLFFILFYLKSNPLQVVFGRIFGLPQCKANVWLHVLLPVLQAALFALGDCPSRSMTDLAKRFADTVQEPAAPPDSSREESPPQQSLPEQTGKAPPAGGPLFVMTAPKGEYHAPKTRIYRKYSIAARKNATR
jgi:Helix-turn-helix of DDE superfamily endonuclease